MAFIIKSKSVQPTRVLDPPSRSSKPPYEIPQRYRDSFYLANASFFDSTNWYLHKAFEVFFPKLKENLRQQEECKPLSDNEVQDKVEGIVKVLDQCNSIIDVRFPIRRDNGTYEVVRGFRANYGLGTGYKSCLGGVKLGETITRDQMKGFSVLAAYKNACLGINMAGAHGGIKINPKIYSENELNSIVDSYAVELMKKGYCSERDIIHPDINTSTKEMDRIANTYAKFTGKVMNVTATGKSQDCGGFEHYPKMPSQAAYVALSFVLNNQQLLDKVGLSAGLKDKRFIIQGVGKLGAPLAQLLVEKGAICVGVKDIDAYIYDAKGIDVQKLLEHKGKMGSFKNYGLAKEETNDEIFKQDCDILIFAAQHKALNCYIANDVKAKLILEAADGPITPTAHQILTGRKQLVIPDLYACTGGTICSYLEYLSGLQKIGLFTEDSLRFSRNIYGSILKNMCGRHQVVLGGNTHQTINNNVDEKILTDSLECVLTDVGNEMVKLAEMHQLKNDIRTAAYMIGISNIFNALYCQRKFI